MRALSWTAYAPHIPSSHTGPVRTFWKVLAVLVLTLPVGAYVAGTLVASQQDAPTRRSPIVLTEVNASPGSGNATPSPSPTAKPSGGPTPSSSDDGSTDHRPRAITPTPHEVGEERADRAADRADRAADRAEESADGGGG